MVKKQIFLIRIQAASFVHVKTDDICKDIAGYVETRFDTSNYHRPLLMGL